MRMRLSLCSTIEQLHGVGIQHACYWIGVTEAYKHIVHRLLYAAVRPMQCSGRPGGELDQ